MAQEALQILGLKEDFYRDSFGKVIFIVISMIIAIILLVTLSVYLYLNKPRPTTFPVDQEWRVQKSVPVNQPYPLTPDMLQWMTRVFNEIFVLDFVRYQKQVIDYSRYFTDEGLTIYKNQLNNFANYNNIQTNHLFVTATPTAAPTIINQGLLAGRYAWWVQVPITINFYGFQTSSSKQITFQVLVVRVPTLNNIAGVAIDNLVVAKGQ